MDIIPCVVEVPLLRLMHVPCSIYVVGWIDIATAASATEVHKLRKDYRNGPTSFTTSSGNANLGLR